MYDDDDEHRGLAIALSVFATTISIISLIVGSASEKIGTAV